MSRSGLAIFATIFVTLCAFVPVVTASQLLVENLSLPVYPNHYVGFNNVVIEAIGFTTSSQGATLTEATAEIGAFGGTTFFAQIWSTNVDRPGFLLASLNEATVQQTGQQLIDFSSNGISLQPHTSYWLVVGTNGYGANWTVNLNSGQVSPMGWTIDARTQSNDGGLTWLGPRTDAPLRFSLSGVPEPSTVILLLSGLVLGGRAIKSSRFKS
jgi:hypothetical protein